MSPFKALYSYDPPSLIISKRKVEILKLLKDEIPTRSIWHKTG